MADDPSPREGARRDGEAPQLPALTGFRALAAAMVLVGHVETGRDVGSVWIVRYGWTGVNLFFALSGFLFTRFYFDRFTTGTVTLRSYFLKRAFRVLPLTWALVLLAVVTSRDYALGDVVAHLTLTHAYFETYRFSINPPMWTLCLEESFYLAVPPLFVALGAIERARPAASALARVLAVGVCLALLAEAGIAITGDLHHFKHSLTGSWDNGLWVMTLTGRFSDFACGILAGVVALRAPTSRWLRHPIGATALFALGGAVWWGAARGIETRGGPAAAGSFAGYQLVSRLFSAGGALMILGLAGRSWLTPTFASRPIVYAGRISFALYLVQDTWIDRVALSHTLSLHVRGHVRPEVAVVLALYALTSVAAALLHHGVEDPAQRYLRRRFVRG